jgi:hypothetical protein
VAAPLAFETINHNFAHTLSNIPLSIYSIVYPKVIYL